MGLTTSTVWNFTDAAVNIVAPLATAPAAATSAEDPSSNSHLDPFQVIIIIRTVQQLRSSRHHRCECHVAVTVGGPDRPFKSLILT